MSSWSGQVRRVKGALPPPMMSSWDTHRLRVFAVVSGSILGQPLLLLVERPRLQDHLLQLEGGVAVQTTFLQVGVGVGWKEGRGTNWIITLLRGEH